MTLKRIWSIIKAIFVAAVVLVVIEIIAQPQVVYGTLLPPAIYYPEGPFVIYSDSCTADAAERGDCYAVVRPNLPLNLHVYRCYRDPMMRPEARHSIDVTRWLIDANTNTQVLQLAGNNTDQASGCELLPSILIRYDIPDVPKIHDGWYYVDGFATPHESLNKANTYWRTTVFCFARPGSECSGTPPTVAPYHGHFVES